MGFDSIRENKRESATFMAGHIEKVIKTFGKRPAGSEGEKKAAEYMGELLKPYADDIRLEPFTVYPAAFMGWIYISVSLYLIALAAYFFQPVASLVLFVVATALMVGEFVMYKQVVDKLFVKKTSHNLYAVKHPTGEVHRRIIFSGHVDAAHEWTFNYHLGGKGYIAHVITSFIGVFYFFIAIILCIANKYSQTPFLAANVANILGYVCLAFVPLWIAMYFMWNEKIVVDGANDDLTGCFMSIAVLKALKDQNVNLENTEVGVLITGSEEAGLRGATAFTKRHKGENKDVETYIIAFDTMRDYDYMTIYHRDMTGMVKNSPEVVALLDEACNDPDVNHPLPHGVVPFGASDAAAFSRGGFKAAAVAGQNPKYAPYYHNRRDTPDQMIPETFALGLDIALAAIEAFDRDQK